MQAIRVNNFGGPEVLHLETTPVPTLETDTQVLVEIRAVGVNPVDTYIRAGTYGRLPTLPYTPGVDGAGVVTAIGAAVTDLRVGDRVYGGWPLTGTYAQFALYDRPWVYPLASHLSFEQGACLFVPYSTAYRALFEKARAQPGDRVLIHGATGAVGLAAVQLALAAGLTVIGTGGSPAGRELVAQQGDVLVLDHHSPTYPTDLMRATAGEGVTIIVEMLANLNLSQDLTWLSPAGRVVVVGSRGEVTIDPRHILSRESWVTGVNLFSTPPETLHRIQKALYAGLINRSLCPILSHSLPLEAAAQAHQQVLSAGAQGNRVLLPAPLEL
ncbi:MAG: NADPH:quinone reductase [Nodosilinea sp. LVE1205-7]|jgi:NADPH2:quinone reductase